MGENLQENLKTLPGNVPVTVLKKQLKVLERLRVENRVKTQKRLGVNIVLKGVLSRPPSVDTSGTFYVGG